MHNNIILYEFVRSDPPLRWQKEHVRVYVLLRYTPARTQTFKLGLAMRKGGMSWLITIILITLYIMCKMHMHAHIYQSIADQIRVRDFKNNIRSNQIRLLEQIRYQINSVRKIIRALD